MNTAKLRSKRVILPVVAAVAALAIGGTVWTATADDNVDGSERDRVANAATEAVGGGTAVDVEASDDRGEAFEVEVRKDDGTEVDVALDEDLKVVGQETDDDDDRDDEGDDDGDRDEAPETDDRVLSDAERASAEKAALAAVDGATSAHVEASDDPGVAYEAEVIDADNAEWDVDLDADFKVVAKALEN